VKRKPEKQLTYFEVLDALKEAKECPLCLLEARGVRRYLEALLYESVNDPLTRDALLRSKGYCHRHAHLLLSLESPLGTALLYQDQVNFFLRLLKQKSGATSRVSWRKPHSIWKGQTICPVCRVQAENRRRYVSGLLRGLSEKEMRKAFENCPALCIPHFLIMMREAASDNLRHYILDIQQRKLSHLSYELKEFCRKYDYRFSHEPFGSERDSWRRAVNLIVGEEGIF